jgi:hypothetical protein
MTAGQSFPWYFNGGKSIANPLPPSIFPSVSRAMECCEGPLSAPAAVALSAGGCAVRRTDPAQLCLLRDTMVTEYTE